MKPFAFLVHGCTDRDYTLEVASSNKLPEIMSQYYLKSELKALQKKKKKMKAHDGNELSLIETIHIYLRIYIYLTHLHISTHIDLMMIRGCIIFLFNSVLSSQSTYYFYCSKRIVDRSGWWKSFFQEMIDWKIFDVRATVLLGCIRFCFMSNLRQEVTDATNEWKQHII